MKSVYHLRIDGPGYDSSAIEKAWRDLGYRYESINWQHYRFNHGCEGLRAHVLEEAKRLKPDLIFCHIQTQEPLDLFTFRDLQAIGNVINYTFDARNEDKMQWMYEIAPYISLTVFASMDDVDCCKSKNINNVVHSHSSCDMDFYFPPKTRFFAKDIVFIGNNYVGTNLNFPLAQERQDMIARLHETYGEKFTCYGLGQKDQMIYPPVESDVYRHTAIAIAHNNLSLPGYTSDRLWRIMASGAFCLTKYYPGIQNDFVRGHHLDWFSDLDEMIEKIDYYLAHKTERLEISERGCIFVRAHHRWEDRLRKIIAAVQ